MRNESNKRFQLLKKRSFAATLFCLVALLLCVVLWSVGLISNRFTKWLNPAYRRLENFLVYSFNQVCLIFFGVDVIIENAELYSANEPCILISNHSSLVDIPVVYEATSPNVRMLAKKELFLMPFMGWALKASHFVGVSRGKKESRQKAKELLSLRLKSGYQIYMAPEGTRSLDGKLLDFKSGAFRIAVEQEVPILVLALKKPWTILPKNSLWPNKKGSVVATFAGKLYPNKDASVEQEIQRLHTEAKKLMIAAGLEASTKMN